MTRFIFIFFTCLFFANASLAQSDVFTGTWHMDYSPPGTKQIISIDLQLATPEKNQLYPAELRLQYDSFVASYRLLLVKKNIRQLAIGKNKFPFSETPFSVGNWTVYLNGVFDIGRDIKGNPVLTAERIFTKQYGVDMAEPGSFPESERIAATRLRDVLRDVDIKLRKVNTTSWESSYIDSILNPNISEEYHGIIAPISVSTKNGAISLSGNKKNSGIVSVVLNGNTVIDMNNVSATRPTEEIKLDTGLNILVFFADNYGKTINSTGNLQVDLGDRKFSLDFANKKDLASTFIVAKIYYTPDKDQTNSNNAFQNNILHDLSDSDLQRDIKINHYPDPEGRNLLKNDSAKAQAQRTLLRDAKPIGSVKTSAREIILAVWDDALEDGDTISLNINGHWIAQRFPVKKKPQFIAVTIEPGPNKIIFIADNLGSIPPNTSVLEIIDGRQRKSFMIETDLGNNNLINILYDAKPD